jgi:hypothetical protein
MSDRRPAASSQCSANEVGTRQRVTRQSNRVRAWRVRLVRTRILPLLLPCSVGERGANFHPSREEFRL